MAIEAINLYQSLASGSEMEVYPPPEELWAIHTLAAKNTSTAATLVGTTYHDDVYVGIVSSSNANHKGSVASYVPSDSTNGVMQNDISAFNNLSKPLIITSDIGLIIFNDASPSMYIFVLGVKL